MVPAVRACSCATAYLLTDAQHTLRAGIVRDDRELFHQIIVEWLGNFTLLRTSTQMVCIFKIMNISSIIIMILLFKINGFESTYKWSENFS